jgi:hypothetical protein
VSRGCRTLLDDDQPDFKLCSLKYCVCRCRLPGCRDAAASCKYAPVASTEAPATRLCMGHPPDGKPSRAAVSERLVARAQGRPGTSPAGHCLHVLQGGHDVHQPGLHWPPRDQRARSRCHWQHGTSLLVCARATLLVLAHASSSAGMCTASFSVLTQTDPALTQTALQVRTCACVPHESHPTSRVLGCVHWTSLLHAGVTPACQLRW